MNNEKWEQIKKDNGKNNFFHLIAKQLFYTSK